MNNIQIPQFARQMLSNKEMVSSLNIPKYPQISLNITKIYYRP